MLHKAVIGANIDFVSGCTWSWCYCPRLTPAPKALVRGKRMSPSRMLLHRYVTIFCISDVLFMHYLLFC